MKPCAAGSKHSCVRTDTPVALAMLYTGGASVPEAIASLRKAGAEGILTIPMFPQYCGAIDRRRIRPGERRASLACAAFRRFDFVSSYHDDAAYIEALAAERAGSSPLARAPRATC